MWLSVGKSCVEYLRTGGTRLKKQSESSVDQWVTSQLQEKNPDAVMFDDIGGALVGVGRQWANKPVAVYSVTKILEELEKVYEFSEVDAAEWFSFNIECFSTGENTPILLYEEPH